ncbi:dehydrogenase [Paraphoma chrysanthemicola]|uniref:Dehydrogenase n=1 Tax=Paraphoma chrysanthemicola TaxID=798071 RepID=A0A8K0R2X5_9PLEO|nr:dehydrogenase [Paraphoma chrysanthemicola]
MAHISPLHAPHFVATRSAEEIAKRLREDEVLIHSGQSCSWVAWHLKGYDTEKGAAIAACLAPRLDLSHDTRGLIYDNLVRKIRQHLKNEGFNGQSKVTGQQDNATKDVPAPSELSTALKVMLHLQGMAVIQSDTPARTIVAILKELSGSTSSLNETLERSDGSNVPNPPLIPRKRLCYICRTVIATPNPAQPSLCIPCNAFNHSSSLLSTPSKLSFSPTFVALVTGARVNLGYHTALRLLRCGARVIATTRYPRAAIARYLSENDSSNWKNRLKIIGADFRSAADAFALVDETKKCLSTWSSSDLATKLCAVINNAAQTLTDSVEKEQRAIDREKKLKFSIEDERIMVEDTYQARIRGDTSPLTLKASKESTIHYAADTMEPKLMTTHPNIGNVPQAEVETYTKSSWVQSIFEIPYEDVMSAHAVNTFVPLILCRELLPLMGSNDTSSYPTSTKPQGYIINVSSREGIFEDGTKSTAKRGKHVHTNMSKAALNMITETEAAVAWQKRRVAMNTVDPGYMSAAPEFENAGDGVRPIGWEDGAGRLLWPIAIGELEDRALWGRFLKHYGAVEVDPGVGK